MLTLFIVLVLVITTVIIIAVNANVERKRVTSFFHCFSEWSMLFYSNVIVQCS